MADLLYRCMNSKCCDRPGIPGHDLAAPKGTVPQCDLCGLKGDDPRHGHLIIRRVVVHFEAPHPVVDSAGVGYPACAPEATPAQTGKVRRTASPQAVNCPKCKATPAFLEAERLSQQTADDALHEVEVQIDLTNQQVLMQRNADGLYTSH